jgi:hypothetical protein
LRVTEFAAEVEGNFKDGKMDVVVEVEALGG